MVDKHGFPVAVNISKANVHDTVGIVPALREASADGFRGKALGDLSYQGEKLQTTGRSLGIEMETKGPREPSFRPGCASNAPSPGSAATVA